MPEDELPPLHVGDHVTDPPTLFSGRQPARPLLVGGRVDSEEQLSERNR